MFDIHPLTPAIGAEVRGLDVREPLDAAAYTALADALHTHQVLFFRDQDATAYHQRDFAAGFGTLQRFPFGEPRRRTCRR